MPTGHPTSLFVSSTCYDLSQVRADMADFARTMGLEPVLSELDSFPIDPSSDTVSNCLAAVRNRADIFVLIVGGRYGSLVDSGKSVTNLEYVEATAKGVPRYVFVKRDILSLLPTWKANPDANFSASVDTPKLFEFVASLRGSGNLWVFPFDSAQDVAQTLRKQISYLLSDSLSIRNRLSDQNTDLQALGPRTLRIFLDKPRGWEFRAFAAALLECLARHKSKKLDYEFGLNFEKPIAFIDAVDACDWVKSKADQMAHIVDNLSRAVNNGLEVAVGAPGEPGDIARIWHLAERVGDAYSFLLDWALEFDRVESESEFKRVATLARQLVAETIPQLESFADSLPGVVDAALATPEADKQITLSLTVGDTSELIAEMRKLYEQ